MRPQLIPVGHRVGPLGDRGAIGRLVDIGAGNTGNTRRQWCWEHWETMVLLEHWETVVLETLGDSGAGNTGRQWCWKHWETVVLETLGTLKDSGAGNTGRQWGWEHWEIVFLPLSLYIF